MELGVFLAGVALAVLCLRTRTHMRPTSTPGAPTDYGALVLRVLGEMTRDAGALDQARLRQLLGLASSYLVTDAALSLPAAAAAAPSSSPSSSAAPDAAPADAAAAGAGAPSLTTWARGLDRLIDVLVALHARGELELATVNEAAKACSECWGVGNNWRALEACKDTVRGVAARLKTLLDENGRTYKGGRVYAP